MRTLKRLAAVLFVVIAASSLLVSLFILLQTWRLRPQVTAQFQESVAIISATLSTTSDGLVIAAESLTTTQASIAALQATVDTLGRTIDDTGPLVESLTSLMAEDLPETVTSAQTSLGAAQQSARIIHAVLRTLTIFSPSLYNPPVPLDQALAQVSQSLDGLPQAFKTMKTSLQSTQVNLSLARDQVDQIAVQIGQINSSLQDAQVVIAQYQALVVDMQARTRRLYARIPVWVDGLAWFLSFVVFWLGISQVGVILRARQWLGSN